MLKARVLARAALALAVLLTTPLYAPSAAAAPAATPRPTAAAGFAREGQSGEGTGCTRSSAEVTATLADAQATLAGLRTERDALQARYWEWYQRLSAQTLDCQAFQSDYAQLRKRLEGLDGSTLVASLRESYQCVIKHRESLAKQPPSQAIAARMSDLTKQRKTIDTILAELDVIASKRDRLAQGIQENFLNACASFR